MNSEFFLPESGELPPQLPLLGLGIDTGGTQTRWALANQQQSVVASGTAEGFTALQFGTREGKTAFQHLFATLAATARSHGELGYVKAGITGFSGEQAQLHHMIARIFELPDNCVSISNDIEIAYLDIFSPGAGYLIYAGVLLVCYPMSCALLHDGFPVPAFAHHVCYPCGLDPCASLLPGVDAFLP